MKKLIACCLIASLFASCVSKKNAEQLQEQTKLLEATIEEKDSIINDVFASLNSIAENINAIKSRENIISSSVASGEIRKQTSVQINEDIAEIDKLLQKNRETIARLERNVAQLRSTNGNVASLEKLISELNVQIDDKNKEIMVLRQQISQLMTQVNTLTERVDDLAQTNTDLADQLVSKEDQLNSVYYIVGSQKNLMTLGIVYKSGFIGRTLKANENYELERFTQVDARNFSEVMIGRKNITVVSSHPQSSYELVMSQDGVYNSLLIKDAEKFWSMSRVLIISYK